jgi:hypothetical protein
LGLSKYQNLMRAAMSQLNLSERAYHRILKLSRTIADLAGSGEIQSSHLAEALHLQPPEDHAGVIVCEYKFRISTAMSFAAVKSHPEPARRMVDYASWRNEDI